MASVNSGSRYGMTLAASNVWRSRVVGSFSQPCSLNRYRVLARPLLHVLAGAGAPIPQISIAGMGPPLPKGFLELAGGINFELVVGVEKAEAKCLHNHRAVEIDVIAAFFDDFAPCRALRGVRRGAVHFWLSIDFASD